VPSITTRKHAAYQHNSREFPHKKEQAESESIISSLVRLSITATSTHDGIALVVVFPMPKPANP
jgi:hypothetical protein